jgi:hypothetical protein
MPEASGIDVAGGAAARVEHRLSVFEIGRVGRQRARPHGCRHGHDPERGSPDRQQSKRNNDEAAHAAAPGKFLKRRCGFFTHCFDSTAPPQRGRDGA